MIVVTNTNDTGAGSLRAAIAAAASGEEITFSVTGTIVLTSTELTIAKNLIITGPGNNDIIISGNGVRRAFVVSFGFVVTISGIGIINCASSLGSAISNQATLTLNDIQIGNCASTAGAGAIFTDNEIVATNLFIDTCSAVTDGGAIVNTGTLTITNLIIASCTAGGSGGGVWNDGTWEQYGGSITNCSADSITDGGGGIFNDGSILEMQDLTINNNSSPNGNGGGILSGFGFINIARCTVSNNEVTGIHNISGTLMIDNSTISGNVGFGVFNGASMDILHSTIVNNGSGAACGTGAGLTLYDTILAGNTSEDYSGDTADVTSNGHNILGVNNSPITPNTGDQSILTYVGLVIGPLQDNGGPTFTHALLAGSPAIDAGDNTAAPATDQRGFTRVINGTIDIGAYESDLEPEPPEPPEPPVPPEPEPTPLPPEPPEPVASLTACDEPKQNCGPLGRSADDATPGIANLSAEAPDVDVSTALPYPPGWVKPPLGGDANKEPIVSNPPYTGPQPCYAPIFNNLGQIVGWKVVDCSPAVPNENGDGNVGPQTNPDWKVPPSNYNDNPTSRTVYPNEEQTCTRACPDGTIITKTMPANTFFKASVFLANQAAMTQCQMEVIRLTLCISGTLANGCLDKPYLNQLNAITAGSTVVWSVASGSLPPGLILRASNTSNLVSVLGIPSVPGEYTFVLRAVNNLGSTMQKSYTMRVIGITTTLPDPQVGVVYSEQLVVAGGEGEATWEVTSGSLPPGLTLGVTGMLAGVPTSEGLYSFTIGVTTSGTTCTTEFILDVIPTAICSATQDIVWTPTNTPGGGIVVTNTAAFGTVDQRVEGTGAQCINVGVVTAYNGPSFTLRATITWSASGASAADSVLAVEFNGLDQNIGFTGWVSPEIPGPGVHEILLTFREGDGIPATDDLTMSVQVQSQNALDFSEVNVVFECVPCPVEDTEYSYTNLPALGVVSQNSGEGGIIQQSVGGNGASAIASGEFPWENEPAINMLLHIEYNGTIGTTCSIQVGGPGVTFVAVSGDALIPVPGTYEFPLSFTPSGPGDIIIVDVSSGSSGDGLFMSVYTELTCTP